MKKNIPSYVHHEGSRPMDMEELIHFFESLVFLRSDESESARPAGRRKKPKLDERALRILDETHVIGRIFRHWYQVTWGNVPWHDMFYGETPRQGLAAFRDDISTGEALCTVNLSFVRPDRPIVVARVFDSATWREYGGPFSFGCAELDANPQLSCVAPNFDPEFRTFVSDLRTARSRMGNVPVRKRASDEETYLRLFLDLVGEKVVGPFSKGVPEGVAKECADEVRDIFAFYLSEQRAGRCDFIRYDHLSADIWRVLCRIIPDLLPQSAIENDRDASRKDPVYARTIGIFFKLHQIVDRRVFLPLDLYFGAVEMVWQDKETFARSFAGLYETLCRGRVEIDTFGRIPKNDHIQRELKKVDRELHINHIANMWSNPPTCFRMLDRVLAWL